MPRLWEERVGGSAEMGHGARRGEEAVGGSGRWGYRTEDDGEGVQRQGIGGRGTGRSREERWTLEKQHWMYIQLIVRFTLGTSDFHYNEIVLISQGIWVANIFFLKWCTILHPISTTQLKKKKNIDIKYPPPSLKKKNIAHSWSSVGTLLFLDLEKKLISWTESPEIWTFQKLQRRVNDVTERGMGGVSSNASFSKIVVEFLYILTVAHWGGWQGLFFSLWLQYVTL